MMQNRMHADQVKHLSRKISSLSAAKYMRLSWDNPEKVKYYDDI